jgi:tetratricopeptide (TPR) repeat protein
MVFLTQKQINKWENHVNLFSQAVGQYPNNIQARKYLANGYWAKQELDSAIYHIEYAINELGSLSSSSFELLANCYSDKGEVNKAIAFYKEALRLDPDNVAARYHKAILIYETDPEESIDDFNICELSDNEYIKSLIYAPRGRAYGITRQYQKAIKDFSKAIEFEPLEAYNYIDRGTTYRWMGETELANNDFDRAAKIDPSIEIE